VQRVERGPEDGVMGWYLVGHSILSTLCNIIVRINSLTSQRMYNVVSMLCSVRRTNTEPRFTVQECTTPASVVLGFGGNIRRQYEFEKLESLFGVRKLGHGDIKRLPYTARVKAGWSHVRALVTTISKGLALVEHLDVGNEGARSVFVAFLPEVGVLRTLTRNTVASRGVVYANHVVGSVISGHVVE